MSTQHDEARHPFWTVFAIFDPDGAGSDFAYTAGLAERGLPELHLWSRPCLGSDPGDDWKFSQRDSCHILNELAWRLLDGELQVGDTWSEEYDAGLVTAHFRVDPAQEAEELDAFQAPEGARVLPIRWSLEREPAGPPQPMQAPALAASQTEIEHLMHGVVGGGPVPAGWELPEAPDWSPEARFGPRTPVVLARAASVWTATPEVMIDIVHNLSRVDMHGSLTEPAAIAASTARPCGRSDGLLRLQEAIPEAARGFGETWGLDSCPAVMKWMDALGSDEEARFLRNLRGLIADGLAGFLCTAAVVDVLDPAARLLGLGPIQCGIAGPGLAPGPEWLASGQVLDVLRRLVASMSVDDLTVASLGWDRTQTKDDACDSLRGRVEARSVTSASFPPHPQEWLSFSTALMLKQRLHPRPLALVQEWGLVVTTVLTHRGEFSSEQVDAFVRASGAPVGLAQALNEPMVDSRSA